MQEKKKDVRIVPYPMNGYDPTLSGPGGGYFGVPFAFVEETVEEFDNR